MARAYPGHVGAGSSFFELPTGHGRAYLRPWDPIDRTGAREGSNDDEKEDWPVAGQRSVRGGLARRAGIGGDAEESGLSRVRRVALRSVRKPERRGGVPRA